MARKVIGMTTKEQLDIEELQKQLEALKAENDALKKHVDLDVLYGDKIKEMAGKSFREIMSEGNGQDWYNYLMDQSLNDLVDLIGSKGKESVKRGKRIPRDTQRYYALLAISEGAGLAKEIKAKYGDHINGPVWGDMVKEGYLEKEGDRPNVTYSLNAKGQEYLEELGKTVNP